MSTGWVSEGFCLTAGWVSEEICVTAGACEGFSRLLGSLLVTTIFLRSFNLPGSDSQVARPITTLWSFVVSRKNFMSSLTWKMSCLFLPISWFCPTAEIKLNINLLLVDFNIVRRNLKPRTICAGRMEAYSNHLSGWKTPVSRSGI